MYTKVRGTRHRAVSQRAEGLIQELLWLDVAQAVRAGYFISSSAAQALRAKGRGPKYIKVRRAGRGSSLCVYNREDLDAWMRLPARTKGDQCTMCKVVKALRAEVEDLRAQLGAAYR